VGAAGGVLVAGGATRGQDVVLADGSLLPGAWGERADAERRVAAPGPAWRPGPALPGARAHAGAAVLDGVLYVVGGMGEAGPLGTVLAWDAQGGRWQARHPLATARSAPVVVALGGALYAVGGVGVDGRPAHGMEVYDPTADAWTAGPEFPGSSDGAGPGWLGAGWAGGPLGGDLAIVGGFGDALWRYAPAGDTWSSRHAPILGGLAAVADGDRLLAVGGEPAATGQIRAFDDAGGSTVLGVLAHPRWWLAAAGLGGRLYVAGGALRPGLDPWPDALDAVEACDLDACALVAPLGEARRGVALVAHEGVLWAIGGEAAAGSAAVPVATVEQYEPGGP
jgi:hypothetical protein